jgi:hypothetical protein
VPETGAIRCSGKLKEQQFTNGSTLPLAPKALPASGSFFALWPLMRSQTRQEGGAIDPRTSAQSANQLRRRAQMRGMVLVKGGHEAGKQRGGVDASDVAHPIADEMRNQ